jgi:hypothetical protein
MDRKGADFRYDGRMARTMAERVLAAAALVLLLAVGSRAADGPSLPPGPDVIGPLRRGDDGKVEIVTPETERKSGRKLCDAGALCVGPGEAYPTLAAALAAARPGATIDMIGETFHEAATLAVAKLTVRGTAGRPHLDCAGVALGAGKACLVIAADGITLDNIEISGAAVPPSEGGDGACIRSDGDASFTLNDIFCHGSQNGLIVAGGTVAIVHSEFYENGGTGTSRNAAFGADCIHVTVTGSTFRDTRGGDEFSSSCLKTEISDSTFRSTQGRRAVDFPDGGDAMIYRSSFEKTAGATSKEIIAYASQSCDHPGALTLKEVAIKNSRVDAEITNYDKCTGGPISMDHVTVEGLAVAAVGFFTDMGGNDLTVRAPGVTARDPFAPKLPSVLPAQAGPGLPPGPAAPADQAQ